mgnify:CR=1 FL=1
MSHFGKAWERLLKVEVIFIAFMGKLIELSFVGFQVFDEVDKVTRLFEFFKVLSIDNISELILNSNNELNCIKGIKAVVGEFAIESHTCLFGCAEVIFNH